MKKTTILLYLAVFFLWAQPVSAAQSVRCTSVFEASDRPSAELSQLISRKDLPKVFFHNGHRPLPAFLVNPTTLPNFTGLLSHSFGVVTRLMPDIGNDHGLLRLGSYFIDRDVPGRRGKGEIHTTGISWSDVGEYVRNALRKKSFDRVEILFEVTPREQSIIDLYHRLRRSAIVRPEFGFMDGDTQTGMLARFDHGRENCFEFCTGYSLQFHQQETESRFQEQGFAIGSLIKDDKQVRAYIESIEKLLMASPVGDAEALAPDLTLKIAAPAKLTTALRAQGLKEEKIHELLNFLVAYKIGQDYEQVLKDLQVEISVDTSNMKSPRASAILVYGSLATPEGFLEPEFQIRGSFSTWNHRGAKKDPSEF
jgi:hypothetical protein